MGSEKVKAIQVKSSRRILLNGRVSGAKLVKINPAGNFTEMKILLPEEGREHIAVIGSEHPSTESFSKSVDQLDKDQFLISMRHFCHLNVGLDIKSPDTVIYKESQFGLVSFLLADCKVIVLVEEKLLDLVLDTVSEHFMIDIFRPSARPSGVELVLRQVVKLDQCQDTRAESNSQEDA